MAQSGPPTPQPHRAQKRVVLVDDDGGLLEIVGTFLVRAGHEVVRFRQFKDARKYLNEQQVDVLVSDIRLGLFNGLQLAILAKIQRPEMLAVVMTGFDDPVVRQEAAKAGVEFLLKPFAAEELLARIG